MRRQLTRGHVWQTLSTCRNKLLGYHLMICDCNALTSSNTTSITNLTVNQVVLLDLLYTRLVMLVMLLPLYSVAKQVCYE